MNISLRPWLWLVLAIGAGGCARPLTFEPVDDLQKSVVELHRRQLSRAPQIQPERSVEASYLLKDPARVAELDKLSGPDVYTKRTQAGVQPGPSLDGQESPKTALSLPDAIRRAIDNNLDVRVARLGPSISQAELEGAEAVFDYLFFTDAAWARTDRPQVVPTIGGVPLGTPSRLEDGAELVTGIRKPLETGGTVTLSTGFNYANNRSAGLGRLPDPSFTSDILIGLNQPLLRGFGAEVNRAQINLASNATRRDLLEVNRQVLRTVGDTEAGYWRLVEARHRLSIAQNLLDMTLKTRDTVFKRAELDGGPIQKAQSQTSVEQRRREVIQAQREVRRANDALKRILNDPDLPLAGELLIEPTDEPAEVAVQHSLLDSVTTGLDQRPEVRQALIDIEDSDIRILLADNQVLPQLDLNAQAQLFGLDDDVDGAYSNLTDGDYVDYLVGAQFEVPLGNRAAEAELKATRLARTATITRYRSVTRQVVQEIKTALRDIHTSWRLISVNRAVRRATAENLRALLQREAKGEALTPEFLDLKLNTQRALAGAEAQELGAIIEYNLSIMRLHQATGTLLQRQDIDVPTPLEVYE